jgi:hypothetical protein
MTSPVQVPSPGQHLKQTGMALKLTAPAEHPGRLVLRGGSVC